ncbi:MAG: aromatic amino acid ammonia-lyase [Crocinitomicaceae bacterium]|nr:aromatic amino acid ammonia-lyase [Crocinitomicaceae bacterium]
MNQINLSQLEKCALEFEPFNLNEDLISQINESFDFLKEFSSDKIIYGINTGFGPMAQFKIDEDKLNKLQYNLIRSHSAGTGYALEEEYVRAVLMARINNFLQANSGISLGVIEKLVQFLNNRISPEIFAHGGVGASGDLVQLAHLALNLIGEGFVFVDGKRKLAKDVLSDLNIKPLDVKLRDGLGLMNGTSCMTGIGAVNLIYAYRLLKWSTASSAMINEVVEAFDDSFSAGLNKVKRHKGQQQIAADMRSFLSDSELIKKREELFKDDDEMGRSEFKKKIQEYYSIRCVPQILGPVLETLDYAKEVIENELNSTNDNPVVSVEDQNVFHGGNFHGDYISLEMDKVKIVVTRLTMLAERQLNFLLNAKLNDKFPAFLNMKKLGFNFGIQGMQFTATSTTAESQTLSNPMYVHSIPNNNDNQDIVSMGTNSAVITKNVIENGFQVMAIHMMAVCQSIDLLSDKEKSRLSSKTMKVYNLIRKDVDAVVEDVPQSENIRKVTEILKSNSIEL